MRDTNIVVLKTNLNQLLNWSPSLVRLVLKRMGEQMVYQVNQMNTSLARQED